jgi:uncharacterized protein (UPF0218 family)
LPEAKAKVVILYSISEDLRVRLKEPFGKLIQGTSAETMNKLSGMVETKHIPKLISVGDMVSLNLFEHKLVPQLAITDNKCMREKIEPWTYPGKRIVYVSNPQGAIAQEAIEAIRSALSSKRETQIIVQGEEDLLALIAVMYAPLESLVVYGQPHEGIVVVEVTPEKKAETKAILKAMKIARKAK